MLKSYGGILRNITKSPVIAFRISSSQKKYAWVATTKTRLTCDAIIKKFNLKEYQLSIT